MTPCDTRPCPVCEKPFSPRSSTTKPRTTCSKKCSDRRHKLVKTGRMAPRTQRPWDALADAPARAEELGPPHPLLLPPEEAARQQAAQDRRMRQAWADGVPYPELVERFGYRVQEVLRQEERQLRPGACLALGAA